MKELSYNEMCEVNGGGLGSFIIGYMFGGVVALVGGGIMKATGQSQEDIDKFIYCTLTIGGSVGTFFPAP